VSGSFSATPLERRVLRKSAQIPRKSLQIVPPAQKFFRPPRMPDGGISAGRMLVYIANIVAMDNCAETLRCTTVALRRAANHCFGIA
jgi:hypothetical protein